MQEKLQEILKNEHLTPARFAELIGVQRSSVSHILSGRNNPSLDFLQKILLHLEHINPDWLISGRGPYKRSQVQLTNQIEPSKASSTTSDNHGKIDFPEISPLKDEERAPYIQKNHDDKGLKNQENTEAHNGSTASTETPSGGKTASEDTNEDGLKQPPNSTLHQKKIIKTVFFYNDQTFEVFYPLSE